MVDGFFNWLKSYNTEYYEYCFSWYNQRKNNNKLPEKPEHFLFFEDRTSGTTRDNNLKNLLIEDVKKSDCFIETGNNKALLIDFNYEQEPVHGTFPFSKIGPLKLLKESIFNHWGKLAFRWIYWNMLLKGIAIPFVSRNMSFKGKIFDIKADK